MQKEKILITGSGGQLGTALRKALIDKYGKDVVIATDLVPKSDEFGNIDVLDATDQKGLDKIVEEQNVTQIYHLAAILSANGEANPVRTWDINLKSWLNVLEAARKYNVGRVFFPSSIAVFGTTANKVGTSQTEYLDPLTVYGISKASGEQWGNYYFSKYGVDVRSLRYPGVIGHESLPGGGTTDYAVEIYHKAINNEAYTCYLSESTSLPMIFMPDAIRATLELMDAPKEKIKTRTSYNINGLSFTPKEIVDSIRKWYPNFSIQYSPDFRQEIAESWPSSINDSQAQQDWNWSAHYQLDDISNEMITELLKKQDLLRQA
ncbi:NAD-dependent epimerase/dehydratase family protein [Flagellimonas pacifica]|uniref:L-threonine 3-dehydrogenase n=1 Tax=Flagellimonas pacifica TaxID=1247520 RepID=A0A285MEA4_9FLAO|nr:NAD-dependent epimerase/dehydratase family protein [Allomuricauda parva]SNY95490.1 L-threonine 3-dehydrogenase [Allomuricauda parva]